MGIRHSVPAGLPTGTVTGKVAGDDWRGDHQHVPFEVSMFLAPTPVAVAAASAVADTEIFSTGRPQRKLIDLSQATQARLTAFVTLLGNATGASLKLSYMTTSAATWAGTNAGPTVIIGGNGGVVNTIHDSGWVNLAAGAKVDNCYLSILIGTALGTTATNLGSLVCYFR